MSHESHEDVNACQFAHVIPSKKKLNYPKSSLGELTSYREKQVDPATKGQSLYKCLICREKNVPELIVATINPPDGLQVIGRP